MRSFTPRDYQRAILAHLCRTVYPRVNVWGGMGVGKTVCVLTWLDWLFNVLGEDGPALILAPLRVAQSTWPDEQRKWKHLARLRLVSITGTAEERRAALAAPAQVFTMNYDNLQWLRDELEKADRPWPFKVVVADESTRLKSYRITQGSKRAQVLGQIARTEVKAWVNLTGTPAPNGLKDLWGQAFFLDFGSRLGRSYSAFQDRWFAYKRKVSPEKQHEVELQVLPFAQEQIEGALRDLTITVRAADYLDLPPLVENVIEVDMPKKAKALYKELEREMFLRLETGAEVEAFNAASLTMKCIAAGTEVLTDRGWLAIENVEATDLVWDGVEWVKTDGPAFNGYRTVVECCGVLMTPDHKVLTAAGWREAQEINNANASKRPVRADVRLPDSYPPRGAVKPSKVQASDVEAPVCLRGGSGANRCEPSVQHPRAVEVVRLPSRGNAHCGLGLPRHDEPPRVGDLEQHEVALPEPERQGLGELRRAWHHGVRSVARLVQKLLGRHGGDVGAWVDAGPERQRRVLQQEKLPMGRPSGSGQQPPGEYLAGDAEGAHDGGPSVPGLRREVHHVAQTPRAGLAREEGSCAAPVFDLVNAGPRQRFVVRGSAGNLLVHNCLQLANGALYTDDAGTYEEIHDAKIQALQSVVEEAAGAPVLVAYHFKSDLARLQRAFPQGRTLDADPRTIADWNAGRVPVLFAHPASAGHGLNLQDGGNIIVFMSCWWDLEQHEQIIERIGPTRQAQSGHNRPVFVHRIIARGTVDKLVLARLQTKASVQSLLLDAMKEQR